MDTNDRTGAGYIEVDRNGLEVLEHDECLRLLATARLGRVGITVGALPVVLPVNFRLVGDRIVFRTSVGTKLDAATKNAIVAFEVDDVEPFSHSGWSVVAIGQVREVTEPAELATLATAMIPRWAPTLQDRTVEISTEMISGRRLVPGLRVDEEDQV